MTWGLVITEPAARRLRDLPPSDRRRINAGFETMRENPYSGDVRFLRGTNGALRRRVGDWRILFELYKDQHLIVIFAIKRRGSNTY
jgi:mRNA interferase RelE/StbE